MSNHAEIAKLCRQVAAHVYGQTPPTDEYADATARMLWGTACVESYLIHHRQIGFSWFGDTGAYSYWQIEHGSIVASVQYLDRRPDVARNVRNWLFTQDAQRLLVHHAPSTWYKIIGWDALKFALLSDNRMGCLFARLHYLRVPAPIPRTVPEQAEYWKRYYNTAAGRGTVTEYLSAWQRMGGDIP